MEKRAVFRLGLILFIFSGLAYVECAKAESAKKIKALIEDFEEPDTQASNKAYGKIVKIGKSAVPYLKEALTDKRQSVRWLAVQALGAIGGKKVIASLIIALGDEDKQVRRYAATFLGRWGKGSQDAAGALKQGLNDKSPEVVWHVMAALDELGIGNYKSDKKVTKQMIKQLTNNDQDERLYAVFALEMIGSRKACKPLCDALVSSKASLGFRKVTADALGTIGCGGVVPFLLKVFDDESKEKDIRTTAALALKSLADKRLNDSALPLLDSGDDLWRAVAANMVGFKNNTEAVAKLVKIVEDKKEKGHVKERALESLGEIGDPLAIKPIGGVFSDVDERMKRTAAEALGKIGTEEAAPYLIEALKEPSPHVVSIAAYHLGKMGCKEAAEPVYELFFRDDAIEVIAGNMEFATVATVAHNALLAITKASIIVILSYDEKSLKKIRKLWHKKLSL